MDAKYNGNRPAYARPVSIDPTDGTLPDGDYVVEAQPGLTKREAFAMAAMQGLLASGAKATGSDMILGDFPRMSAPAFCVQWADALLAELAREV